MFEKYTAAAKRVFFFSRYEAVKFGFNQIEPEHILLGLLREGSPDMFHLLTEEQAGKIRTILEEGLTILVDRISNMPELPLSAESKRVVELAADLGKEIGVDGVVVPSYLFLGVLMLGKGKAFNVLSDQGFDHGRTFEKIYKYGTEKSQANEDGEIGASFPRLTSSDLLVIWNPEALEPEEYAKLVVAIGDLVRASGGKGLRRAEPIAVEVKSPAGVFV